MSEARGEGSRPARISRILLRAIAVMFAVPILFSLAAWDRTVTALLPLKVFALGFCPLLSGAALYASRRASPTTRLNMILAIGSSIVAIYVGEILLPIGLEIRALASAEAVRDEPIDRRDKVEVLLDARARGIDAVSSIEPKGLMDRLPDGTFRSRLAEGGSELLPLGGVANRHTIVCNESGTWVAYQSDRFGMNNPDSVWAFEEIDVVTVGDSFANGWCVETEQHFTHLIRSRHQRMVNLAQSGNGPLLILAGMVEYLLEREPETVLWFHYEGNDFEDLSVEAASPLLRGYLDGTTRQGLAGRQEVIDAQLYAYIESELDRWRDFGRLVVEPPTITLDLATLRSVMRLDNVRELAGVLYTGAYDADYELFARVLSRARDTVAAWGGSLRLIYLPSWHRYRRTDLARRYHEAHDRVVVAAEALGVPVVDVSEAFTHEDDPLALFIRISGGARGHFTPRGNQIVADAVLASLSR